MNWFEACARWYGVIAVAMWAFAPFVSWLLIGLNDRGATVARPIALIVALYPAWLLASLGLTMFRPAYVVAFVAAAGFVGWGVLLRRRPVCRPWLRQLTATELCSLAMFAAYVWLRGYTPQILGTEKPMDIAFLASSARTAAMPPPDPWFAAQPINYYYFGYLIHGTISRIAGVPPEIGFNLALASIFSMTGVAAFGVTWNVVHAVARPRVAVACGLFTAFFAVLAGNLYAPLQLLQHLQDTVNAWWWDSVVGIGWRSSRVVCDGPRIDNLCQFPSVETINEFPFFSFLLGDLHPHLMALPFTIVAIGLSWNVIGFAAKALQVSPFPALARLTLSGVLVGSLYALNAWDYPTYLMVVVFGVIVAWGQAGRTWKAIVALVTASVVAWLPFYLTYTPPTAEMAADLPPGVAPVPILAKLFSVVSPQIGERTSVGEYMTIFGIPYVCGLLLVLSTFLRQSDTPRSNMIQFVSVVSVIAVISGIVLSAPLLPLCGIPLTVATVCFVRNSSSTPRTFALGLFAFAWVVSIGVDFFYLRDVFGNRMNTLFKFYYQVWTLYAVAAGLTLAILWRERSARTLQRTLALAFAAIALLLGLAYPVVASYQWTERFAAWQGLDGLAFGDQTDPDEVAAIRWLSAHGSASDVVLEAAGCSYHPFNRLPFDRVSAFTGVPTVIGWEGHERQWRAGQPTTIGEIRQRQEDVAKMFADPDSPLIDAYHVTWLFVGAYEAEDWRAECAVTGPYANVNAPGYPGPEWQLAFRSGDTRIFRKVSA